MASPALFIADTSAEADEADGGAAFAASYARPPRYASIDKPQRLCCCFSPLLPMAASR